MLFMIQAMYIRKNICIWLLFLFWSLSFFLGDHFFPWCIFSTLFFISVYIHFKIFCSWLRCVQYIGNAHGDLLNRKPTYESYTVSSIHLFVLITHIVLLASLRLDLKVYLYMPQLGGCNVLMKLGTPSETHWCHASVRPTPSAASLCSHCSMANMACIWLPDRGSGAVYRSIQQHFATDLSEQPTATSGVVSPYEDLQFALRGELKERGQAFTSPVARLNWSHVAFQLTPGYVNMPLTMLWIMPCTCA